MKGLLRRMLPAFAKTGIARTLRLTNGMLLRMAYTLTTHGFEVEDSQKIKFARVNGLNVSQVDDFYSPLPSVETLKQNLQRWYKPSDLTGVQYDREGLRTLLLQLVSKYHTGYQELPSYGENKRKGFGPGFTTLDAMFTYFMVRDIKPQRYIEVGSGLSTFYTSLAAGANARSGRPVTMTCIDPYPCDGLKTISGIEIIQKEVQDVPLSFFDQLDDGDILFIDSTHIVKLDGDVPYLYVASDLIPPSERETALVNGERAPDRRVPRDSAAPSGLGNFQPR